jgi:hypothetical protein
MGHVFQHCKAQWKKIQNKCADFVEVVSFVQQIYGASCSKFSHLNSTENLVTVVSLIPQEAPSHSPPNTSLELSIGLLTGDLVPSQPQGSSSSSAMAYQRADPRSLVPPGL